MDYKQNTMRMDTNNIEIVGNIGYVNHIWSAYCTEGKERVVAVKFPIRWQQNRGERIIPMAFPCEMELGEGERIPELGDNVRIVGTLSHTILPNPPWHSPYLEIETIEYL